MAEHTPEIYIVEDDSNIREIESYTLKNSGFSVREFERAKPFSQALSESADALPDLILLDIMLPDEDGISLLRRIRSSARTARIPVLMVTAKTAEIDIVKGLDEGADDYVTKPFGVMELISRVHALLRRTSAEMAEPEEFSVGELRLVPAKWLCTASGERIPLTYKEFELLEILLRNAGIVMKREVLLDRVWGIDYDGETRTLDAHIKTLRQKLGGSGARIETVRNVGYLIR